MPSEEGKSQSSLEVDDRIIIIRGGDTWKQEGPFAYKVVTRDDGDRFGLRSESVKCETRFVKINEGSDQVVSETEAGSKPILEAYYVFKSKPLVDLELRGIWRTRTNAQPIVVTPQNKKGYLVQCDKGNNQIVVKDGEKVYGDYMLSEGDARCLVWTWFGDESKGTVSDLVWSRVPKSFSQIELEANESYKVDYFINKKRNHEQMKGLRAKHGRTLTIKAKEDKFRERMAEKLKDIEIDELSIPAADDANHVKDIVTFVQDEANVRIFASETDQQYVLRIVGQRYEIEMAKTLIRVKLSDFNKGEESKEPQGTVQRLKQRVFNSAPPETTIKNLKDDVKSLKDDVKYLKNINKNLGKDKTFLQKTKESLEKEKASLEDKNASLTRQNNQYERDMINLGKERKRLRDETGRYREHLENSKQRYNEQQLELQRERGDSGHYKNELQKEINQHDELKEHAQVLEQNCTYYKQEAEKWKLESTRQGKKLTKCQEVLRDSKEQEKRQKKQASELLAKVNSLLKIKDVNGSSATADVSIEFPLPGDVVTAFNALKAEGRVDMFEYLDELDDSPFKGGEQCRKMVNKLFLQCIQEAADEHAEIKRKFSDALKVGKEFNQATSSFLANYLKVNYKNPAFFNPKKRMEEVAEKVLSPDELKAVDLSGTVVSEFLQDSLKLGWIMALSTPSFQIGKQDDGSYEDSCYDPASVYGSQSPGGYYIWPCLVQGEVRSRGYYVRGVGEQGATGGTDEAKDSKDVKGVKEQEVSVADNPDPNATEKPDKDGSDEQNVNGENKANVPKDKQCQGDDGEPEIQLD